MNLAIGTLVVFLLVSPAVIARRSYYTKQLSRDFISRNTIQEIFSSIFLAIIFHTIWICYVVPYKGFSIDFDILLKLLFNADHVECYSPINGNIQNILNYFFSLFIASIFVGYGARCFVRFFELDRKFDFLRYDNKWNYLMSAEVLDIENLNIYSKKEYYSKNIEEIRAEILIRSEHRVVYSGIVIDYQLTDKNSLDFIILGKASKRTTYFEYGANNSIKIVDDKIIKRYDDVNIDNSKYLIIPYSEILNISLKYMPKEGGHIGFLRRIFFLFIGLAEKIDDIIKEQIKKKIKKESEE